MLHTSLDWTPFGQYMIDFIKKDKPRPGSTAKESERNLAVHTAEIEMIAQGLAYLGTESRINVLRPLMEKVNEERRWVPMVEQYTVRTWLRSVRERWDNGEFKSIPDDVWLANMDLEFRDLVFDENMNSTIQGYRKDLILAGIINPTPEDREWLQAEAEKFLAVAAPYKSALDRLQTATLEKELS